MMRMGKKDISPRLWLGLVALSIVLVYSLTLLSAGEGRPVAALDDAYIHFQYARQIAAGRPWQYNDGDPFSTGGTSLVYPFLLAFGYRIGFSGERLVWFAFGLGAVCLACATWFVYRISARLLGLAIPDTARPVHRVLPAGAGLLFLLTGAIQWGFLSGMETGLFTVVALATLDAFLVRRYAASSHPLHHPAVWVAVAGLIRPGGLILAGVLWLVVAAQGWDHRRPWRRPVQARMWLKDVGLASLAVVVATLPFLLSLLLSGSPIATGAQAKSWLGNIPFRPWDIAGSIANECRRILERFTAGMLAREPWVVSPGILLLSVAGWAALLRRGRRAVVALSAGWFVLGTLYTAMLITAIWHVGRYQVPFLALIIPFAVLGVAAVADKLPRRLQTAGFATLAVALLATALISTAQARVIYRDAIYTVAHQQLAVADWIQRNLPTDTWVGVHDTGAIRYVGSRPTYDMVGLTTQGAADEWRHGAGSVFERLERADPRPEYFATYPDMFTLPYLAATDLFATELFRAEVPNFGVTSAGPLQAVYRADWELGGSGDRIVQSDMLRLTDGLTLLDRLDVADLRDEARHHLTFWERTKRSGFPTEVKQLRYRVDPSIKVLDGGRLVNGGLRFRVTAQAGRPLVLVARLHPTGMGAVRVAVDGRDLGLWRYPALPGEWLETAFVVPATVVTRDRVDVRLEVTTDDPALHPFAPYYLWVFGGAPLTFAPTPEQPLHARLGEAVELTGYDLARLGAADQVGGVAITPPVLQPGEAVHLVLYWRAVRTPDEDAKVFVHLYDESGEIVTQQDGAPYHGTRPPYTWSAGEMLDDPYTLVLPSDLPAGQYTLAAGMYAPLSGGRLPVDVKAAHRLSENRIRLTTIKIVNQE